MTVKWIKKDYDYSFEEVVKITTGFPAIFHLSVESLSEKLDFYSLLMFKYIFVYEPKKLMQSIDLTYARYMYYKSIGKTIDNSNYGMLFIAQKKFFKLYGIEKGELIGEFNYESNKGYNLKRQLGLENDDE